MECSGIVPVILIRKLEAEDANCSRLDEEMLGHRLYISEYRLKHTTQLRITGRMEYGCIILLHSPRISRAQSLPKEEVLQQQLRSEDAQQQVGPCSTATIHDGREFLPDADADCAQELRVTLIVHRGCPTERRSAKKPTTSANQALWGR